MADNVIIEDNLSNFTMLPSNMTTETVITTTTIAPPDEFSQQIVGYICVLVAVVLFGSNFVPVKKFETGDGVFFQWVLAIAIWMSGLVLHGIRHFPPFCPIAMLGGFLWCTGNMMTVPIIKTIGLGQGILIWASFNLLSGWASARFGWFSMKPEVPGNSALNYAGVALCLVSAFVYMFMKTTPDIVIETNVQQANGECREEDPLLGEERVVHQPVRETNFFERLPPVVKRITGTVMAIIAGNLYGLNFTPVIAYKDNHPKASQNGLDYVFSHFCGILLSSTAYFVIYCFIMCNKPRIYNQAIVPGLAAGVMWAVADIGWFVANDRLSEPISFPMITTVPAMIGALWGIFFREIRGLRNFFILAIAFAIAISGSILTGISGSHPHKVNGTTYT